MGSFNHGFGKCVVACERLESRRLLSGTGSIQGTVYKDVDGDGAHSLLEPVSVGARIFLDQNNNGNWDGSEKSTLTNSHGQYVFGKLDAGTYIVREVIPDRWRSCTPAGGFFQVRVGTRAVTGKDFYNTQRASISGTVFNDLNASGDRDSGEHALSGWRVYADADDDGFYDRGELTTLTSAKGQWTLNGLTRGAYVIRLVKLKQWEQTTPLANDSIIVGVTAATVVKGKLFGAREIF